MMLIWGNLQKSVLTNKKRFDILIKLSARDARRGGERDGANLENDTEKREIKQSDFEELNAVRWARKRRLWRAEGSRAHRTEKD